MILAIAGLFLDFNQLLIFYFGDASQYMSCIAEEEGS